MVGLPGDNQDLWKAWKTVTLAARWPFAALLLAVALYALLRPWGLPGVDSLRLPGAIAGSKVVEEVAVQETAEEGSAAADAGAPLAVGAAAAAPFALTTFAPAADVPALTSFRTPPVTGGGEAPTRDGETRTRDIVEANDEPDARSSPVRTEAGGDAGRPQTKAARKAPKAAARVKRKPATAEWKPAKAERKPAKAERKRAKAERKRAKAERKITHQHAKAHTSRPSRASAAPRARPPAHAAQTAKKPLKAVAKAAKKHGNGKEHVKRKRHAPKRR